ncbi:MAG: D-alanyl-D-alanine carboxypeptidase family protein [Pseudomonadota bacterium]
MNDFPDLLVLPDLLLRHATDADPVSDAMREHDDLRVIEVRSSGKIAGAVARRHGRTRIEVWPSHQRRGRGTEAMAAWLEALLVRAEPLAVVDVDHPAARAFCREFGLQRDGHAWLHTPRTIERLRDLRLARLRRYRQRAHMVVLELGAPGDYGSVLGLPLYAECVPLRSIGADAYGRTQYLAAAAAAAWHAMQDAAAADDVTLQVVSAFRGFDRQLAIVQRKREAGQTLAKITAVSALPGYSEHHTGAALDLTTPGAAVLEADFADTDAYAWLTAHAAGHGFRESYSAGNVHGLAHEPWHWAHVPTLERAVILDQPAV